MTQAKTACVVGPDTGVMNAVAFEEVGKVVMLSHSTKENLTKHWMNTCTLAAQGVACHRLHSNGDFCNQDETTGAALCQQSITAQRIFDAIELHYHRWVTTC